MSIVTIEFLGGPETGNVGETTWANPFTNESLILPIREKVRVDPTASAFFASVVKKARTNRFFKVEDTEAAEPKARKARSNHSGPQPALSIHDLKPKAEADGDEEQG